MVVTPLSCEPRTSRTRDSLTARRRASTPSAVLSVRNDSSARRMPSSGIHLQLRAGLGGQLPRPRLVALGDRLGPLEQGEHRQRDRDGDGDAGGGGQSPHPAAFGAPALGDVGALESGRRGLAVLGLAGQPLLGAAQLLAPPQERAAVPPALLPPQRPAEPERVGGDPVVVGLDRLDHLVDRHVEARAVAGVDVLVGQQLRGCAGRRPGTAPARVACRLRRRAPARSGTRPRPPMPG